MITSYSPPRKTLEDAKYVMTEFVDDFLFMAREEKNDREFWKSYKKPTESNEWKEKEAGMVEPIASMDFDIHFFDDDDDDDGENRCFRLRIGGDYDDIQMKPRKTPLEVEYTLKQSFQEFINVTWEMKQEMKKFENETRNSNVTRKIYKDELNKLNEGKIGNMNGFMHMIRHENIHILSFIDDGNNEQYIRMNNGNGIQYEWRMVNGWIKEARSAMNNLLEDFLGAVSERKTYREITKNYDRKMKELNKSEQQEKKMDIKPTTSHYISLKLYDDDDDRYIRFSSFKGLYEMETKSRFTPVEAESRLIKMYEEILVKTERIKIHNNTTRKYKKKWKN